MVSEANKVTHQCHHGDYFVRCTSESQREGVSPRAWRERTLLIRHGAASAVDGCEEKTYMSNSGQGLAKFAQSSWKDTVKGHENRGLSLNVVYGITRNPGHTPLGWVTVCTHKMPDRESVAVSDIPVEWWIDIELVGDDT